MFDEDADLRALLSILEGQRNPPRRADPRPGRPLADRLGMRYRDERGDDWADIIDMLTMDPESRRRVVRLLGELDAVEGC